MTTISNVPRVVIAALKGGAGKTLITLGVIAALRKKGLRVAPFKKGPDYIDAAWLAMAGGSPCYNLDRYLFGADGVRNSFASGVVGKDLAVVEGNRGLFDGVDAMGTYSTADLARILEAPVILIVDATKMTRTAAALVLGCKKLEPDIHLAGVILNKVAGARHRTVLTEAIENSADAPVIGSIHKLMWSQLPQRHLGLLPIFEHPDSNRFIMQTAELIENQVDLGALLDIARSAPPLSTTPMNKTISPKVSRHGPRVRIGVVRDSAFQFYYPENLAALKDQGSDLLEVSALKDAVLPDVHALYIGGGFPETHAEILAANTSFKTALKRAVEKGLPVYAECGGLMYLCQSIVIDDKTFPMVDIFPAKAVLHRSPQGLGYITVRVVRPNPFYPL
ncbi:MAG: cobyrinate a,c-diamide synthase, partial [Desulfomonilaceae bacterium]